MQPFLAQGRESLTAMVWEGLQALESGFFPVRKYPNRHQSPALHQSRRLAALKPPMLQPGLRDVAVLRGWRSQIPGEDCARNRARGRVRGPSVKQDTEQHWAGEVKCPVTPAEEQQLD